MTLVRYRRTSIMATKQKIKTEKPANVVQEALRDYKARELTTHEIAEKHGICAATLTVWARQAGLKLRTRGRRRLTEPTPMHRLILSQAQHQRYDQIGRKLGLHKQAVHRIVKRWADWKPGPESEFKVGDVLLWKGTKLKVLASDTETGILEDEKGVLYMEFPWAGSAKPKKIEKDAFKPEPPRTLKKAA